MDSTPKNKIVRPRHTPTPKMSERKKALFSGKNTLVSLTIDEDSDLGPMSPLQFSSGSSSYDPNDCYASKGRFMRTDFKGVLKQLSPIKIQRSPSQSPLKAIKKVLTSKQSNSNDQHTETNTNADDVICNDTNNVEKENSAEMLKTPHDLCTNTDITRISFRKSLIFDTGLTPDDDSLSPGSRKGVQKKNKNYLLLNDSPSTKIIKHATINENPKARASLTFSEPLISSKSFYGSSADNVLHPIKKKQSPLISKPINKRKKKTIKKINRPILGSINKGVYHKVFKPKVLTTKSLEHVKNMSKNQLLETAMTLIDNSALNVYLNERNIDFKVNSPNMNNKQIVKEQIATLKDFLKTQNDPIDSSFTETADSSFEESAITDTVVEQEESAEKIDESNTKKRKFFKTKRAGSTSTYQLTAKLSATVKRGSSMKLNSPKKKKLKKSNTELIVKQQVYDIINMLENECNSTSRPMDQLMAQITANNSSILNVSTEDLASNQKNDVDNNNPSVVNPANEDLPLNDKFEHFRQMLPYQTTDLETIQRQIKLLEFLISYDICNDENFKIFIAEPHLHEHEADRILNQLYVVDNDGYNIYDEMIDSADNPNNISIIDDTPMSPASEISNMASGLALGSPGGDNSKETEKQKWFPIFNKGHATTSETLQNVTSNNIRWTPIGENQYQIDAGQKEFGPKTCKQCGMFYTVHEPEEEKLHYSYHNSINILRCQGWVDENILTILPNWGKNGRIIYISKADSSNKRKRVQEILSVVDNGLGFPADMVTNDILTSSLTFVYLAICKNQIIGVCVVEPIKKAYRLKKEGELDVIDTSEVIAVKCGISRIWVAPPYRRKGVAMELVKTMRSHYIRGYNIFSDEIAFSSPTDMGKIFAERLSKHVLVYDTLNV